jgi:glyoxylate/hydroxypyruvate reductase
MACANPAQWPTYKWSPFLFAGPQLSPTDGAHRTVGFVGFGRIAQAVLARLAGFGITHCLFTSNPDKPYNAAIEVDLAAKHRLLKVAHAPLAELAAEADVVVVLAPGGPSTHHIVDETFLRKMKKTAVLVNAARGTLVDTAALATALRERWIWAAALDVIEDEPNIGADHPLVREPRCVLLPHIGSATTETRIAMTTTAAKNALAALAGEDMPAELK